MDLDSPLISDEKRGRGNKKLENFKNLDEGQLSKARFIADAELLQGLCGMFWRFHSATARAILAV